MQDFAMWVGWTGLDMWPLSVGCFVFFVSPFNLRWLCFIYLLIDTSVYWASDGIFFVGHMRSRKKCAIEIIGDQALVLGYYCLATCFPSSSVPYTIKATKDIPHMVRSKYKTFSFFICPYWHIRNRTKPWEQKLNTIEASKQTKWKGKRRKQ